MTLTRGRLFGDLRVSNTVFTNVAKVTGVSGALLAYWVLLDPVMTAQTKLKQTKLKTGVKDEPKGHCVEASTFKVLNSTYYLYFGSRTDQKAEFSAYLQSAYLQVEYLPSVSVPPNMYCCIAKNVLGY